jgi:site-specific DNA-methyltransferase (adenine-specific)
MVTDPPYGISFMNKDWDKAVPDVAIWKECLRTMKPGAFAFVMCSPRSDVQAEMVIKLKEAGFQVNYSPLYWCYLSGFPKAMNISKAVDRNLGYEREMTGVDQNFGRADSGIYQMRVDGANKKVFERHDEPSSKEAKKLDGSYAGFQPKPAVEVIIVAMKPLLEKTYVDQAIKNGKGITWLDYGRIPYSNEIPNLGGRPSHSRGEGYGFKPMGEDAFANQDGRFPANLLVQDNVLDNGIITKSGTLLKKHTITKGQTGSFTPDDWIEKEQHPSKDYPSDEGSLSRYFSLDSWYSKNIEELPDYVQRIFPFLYVPKASNSERNDGLNTFNEQSVNDGRKKNIDNPFQRGETLRKNIHTTVKPLKLMTYLITIGSRPGDTILDPFMGSGTTGVAAKMLHRNFIGFEIEGKYFEIAKERIEKRAATRDIFEFDAMKEMEYEEK